MESQKPHITAELKQDLLLCDDSAAPKSVIRKRAAAATAFVYRMLIPFQFRYILVPLQVLPETLNVEIQRKHAVQKMEVSKTLIGQNLKQISEQKAFNNKIFVGSVFFLFFLGGGVLQPMQCARDSTVHE